ncbi:MAG: shikimate dehydrogenase [Bradyrhizobium sp.]|nr:shikimate dehydrogenase [Bradyrhizobium sp.]
MGKIAGVVGWPVAQSLSPVIHNFWLRHHKLDGVYVALPIAPENFIRCVSALPFMGFAGVNITVPHKQSAVALVESLDEDAKMTRAVNLLVFEGDRIVGANTDVHGFSESLRQSFPHGIPGVGPAVLLGAGGAARGVLLALHKAGFQEVRIVNRTRYRAEAIAGDFASTLHCRILNWGDWETAFVGARLLVNTTSLGMTGKPGLDISLDALPREAVVADIVYDPVKTALLRAAESAGHPVVDGLGMLMHQAVPAFAAWFGVKPMVTPELRALLVERSGRA